MAENQAIAAGELRGFCATACKLIDHLAFGDADIADINGKAQFRRYDFNADMPNADFTNERMCIALAALGGLTQRQQKPLVAAREVL